MKEDFLMKHERNILSLTAFFIFASILVGSLLVLYLAVDILGHIWGVNTALLVLFLVVLFLMVIGITIKLRKDLFKIKDDVKRMM
jgi:membrane protein YdbS with pleckstrin-like domain